VVKSIAAHPARRYFERGVMITINTDDPKMFGNSLAQEYQLLEQQLGFSRNDIRVLILQAIQASWLPPERKQQLTTEFISAPQLADLNQNISFFVTIRSRSIIMIRTEY
jgi:adenosine deaminase/aminodeoxyfutalosine deaminase